MDKVQHYIDIKARYRKEADGEPARRARHLADADAWRLLALTRSFVVVKQNEIGETLAPFDRK